MKNTIIALAIITTGLTACNSDSTKAEETPATEHEHTDSSSATHEHSQTDTTTATASITAFSTKQIVASYLQLKNALTKDNGKDAATAGTNLSAALSSVDMKSIPDAQMKSYMDIADDMKEHAEHISSNAAKIEHQREHFIMLSKDVDDLVKNFGNGGQTLYKDFCPMANEGKGAIWISEVQEIRNPYMGGKMHDCGTVKETKK